MMSTQGHTAHQNGGPGRRGRPRSARVRAAVVRARAIDAGVAGAATVDAIAKRAAVSRTTIYKGWPSSAAIVLEGAARRGNRRYHRGTGNSFKEALEHHLRALNAILTDTGTGPLLRDEGSRRRPPTRDGPRRA